MSVQELYVKSTGQIGVITNMKDNELKKFEEALSARQEMEGIIFRLNDVISSWSEDLSFMKKNLASYDSWNDIEQINDKEELINYGYYCGSARAFDKNITMLKEIVKEYENKLLKGR